MDLLILFALIHHLSLRTYLYIFYFTVIFAIFVSVTVWLIQVLFVF